MGPVTRGSTAIIRPTKPAILHLTATMLRRHSRQGMPTDTSNQRTTLTTVSGRHSSSSRSSSKAMTIPLPGLGLGREEGRDITDDKLL